MSIAPVRRDEGGETTRTRYWERVLAEQSRPPGWWRGRRSRITRWIAASQRRRPKQNLPEVGVAFPESPVAASEGLGVNVVAFRRPPAASHPQASGVGSGPGVIPAR